MRDAILLEQVALLVDFIQQAPFAVPAGYRLQIRLAILLSSKVTKLDDDKRILISRAGGKKNVGVELAWGAFNTVSEMFDERCGGGAMETAVTLSSVKAQGRKKQTQY